MHYCRWEFVDRQKKAKFDSIAEGHAAALISMGVIDKAPAIPDEGPLLPEGMEGLLHHYKRLKFMADRGGDVVTLTPRGPLNFQEIDSYCRVMKEQLTPSDVTILLDIDGIFESRS